MATLSAQQQQTGQTIYRLGLEAGLPPDRADELAAAAFAESRWNANAVNSKSGAAGPFQLLSRGYVDRARALGGVFDVRANTLAILPDYVAYWRAHPDAPRGAAGAAIEKSGAGASFYAAPLAFVHAVMARVRTSITDLLRPQQQVDLNGVDPGLLGRLAALGRAIGKPITITSGYRTPQHSVEVGGSADDPHTKRIAVDATIGGRPIGEVVPAATFARFGLITGNTPGFWPGHGTGGRDPVHVQLPTSEITPGFAAAAANAEQLASWSPTHWVQAAGDWLYGAYKSDPVGKAIGKAGGALFDWTGLTSFVKETVPYAAVYGLLVMFSIVLALLGLLSLLGVRPGTVVSSAVGARGLAAGAAA